MGKLKWNPDAKPMNEKQARATFRNMNKFRLSGFNLRVSNSLCTEREIALIKEMGRIKTALLEEWDKESERLGMKVERYNLYIKSLAIKPRNNNKVCFELFKENITKQEVSFWTTNLNEKDFKIKKIK